MQRLTEAAARALVSAVVVALVITGLTASSARAQTAPPTVPAPDPWMEVVSIAVEYTRVTAALRLVTAQLADVQSRVAAADQAFRDADQQRIRAEDELVIAVDRMQRRAAASYRLHGGSVAHVLEVDRAQALATAAQYVESATEVDSSEVARLTDVARQRTAERDTGAEELRAFAQQQRQLAQTRDLLTARAQSDQVALDTLGGVPVMGTSRLGAQQIAAWFASTGRSPQLEGGTTILDLAQMFVEEGAAERVRGDLAFAQSIIETGYFRETRGNNYAGIGNCDSCGGRGYGFATPRDGVRGQIQLLRSYADPDSRAANLSYPPEAGLYGADPVAAAVKFDTFFLKGKVPLWNQMGGGNWATDPTYAGKVLTVYRRMLEFAAAHP